MNMEIPSPEQFAARSLQSLDGLALECDGLSRSLSMLLQRDDIEHTVCVGELVVDGVGRIALHWWWNCLVALFAMLGPVCGWGPTNGCHMACSGQRARSVTG